MTTSSVALVSAVVLLCACLWGGLVDARYPEPGLKRANAAGPSFRLVRSADDKGCVHPADAVAPFLEAGIPFELVVFLSPSSFRELTLLYKRMAATSVFTKPLYYNQQRGRGTSSSISPSDYPALSKELGLSRFLLVVSALRHRFGLPPDDNPSTSEQENILYQLAASLQNQSNILEAFCMDPGFAIALEEAKLTLLQSFNSTCTEEIWTDDEEQARLCVESAKRYMASLTDAGKVGLYCYTLGGSWNYRMAMLPFLHKTANATLDELRVIQQWLPAACAIDEIAAMPPYISGPVFSGQGNHTIYQYFQPGALVSYDAPISTSMDVNGSFPTPIQLEFHGLKSSAVRIEAISPHTQQKEALLLANQMFFVVKRYPSENQFGEPGERIVLQEWSYDTSTNYCSS
ncbi:hypothetical protein QOT17_023015 [Balamuthia mandrillaris]